MSDRDCVRVCDRPSFRVRLGITLKVRVRISMSVGIFVRVKTSLPYGSNTRLN